MDGLLVACRYLTRLPLPAGRAAGDLGRAAGWFPVVGLVLGALLAAAAHGGALLAPPLLAAVVVVGAWALCTGGLHLDGLADAVDGLGGGWNREETLAIMRDAGTGAYGVTAIVLVIGAKTAALAGLSPGLAWRVLLVAPVIGRLAPVMLARLCPPARGDGAGHAFALSVGPRALLGAGGFTLAAALAVLGAAGGVLVAATAAAAGGCAWYLRVRLGGLTGDCLGALVEASEALTLIGAATLAHLHLLGLGERS
jgi:cobalamin 5'-phosphate synthase/cobalamin synthase